MAGREQSSSSIFPVTSQHFPFAEVPWQAPVFSLSVEDSLVHLLDVTLISSLCRGLLFNCTGLFCDL